MTIEELLQKEYLKNKVDKNELTETTTTRLKKLSKSFKTFLENKKECVKMFPKSMFHYQGKYYHFNFQIRDNRNHINVVMFAFDNAYMINRTTEWYEINSIEELNENFDTWVISNAMTQFFRKD